MLKMFVLGFLGLTTLCASPLGLLELFMGESGGIEVEIRVLDSTPMGPTETALPTFTPTVDLTLITATPLPSPTPTMPPQSMGALQVGVSASGVRRVGQGFEWTFEGEAGQVISIQNNNLGFYITLYDPAGVVIGEADSATLEGVTLPVTGTYRLVAYSSAGGPYGLTIRVE